MKVVALVSGGKDSCYSMMQCVAEGHELVALANLRPVGKDELDSYMYQTVGHHAIELYAEAMGLPLYREDITGTSISQDKEYHPSSGDEVEDLFRLLSRIKDAVDIEAVAVGAILSNYQRVRVENVCARLGLTSLGYLWCRDQEELLGEMIGAGVEAIIIKVAALGLDSRHLFKTLAEIQPHMIAMKEKFQLNPCGEGGEYETFTLDCPLFDKRIVIDEYEVIKHDSDPFAPVCFINFKKMHLQDKNMDASPSLKDRLDGLPIKRGSSLAEELGSPERRHPGPKPSRDSESNPPVLITDKEYHETPGVHMKCSQSGFSWVSGIITLRDHGPLSESIEGAFNSLRDMLTSSSLQLSSVVMIYMQCQDLSEFSAINAVMKTFFVTNPPVRVTIEVNHDRGVIFSMDCLVYQPSAEGSSPLTCEGMHVQGISHWAPANIGPYSQAIRVGDSVYCAGMIGLCPSTMTPIEGGIYPESALCLRSISRVLQAMNSKLQLEDVVFILCCVTEAAFIPAAKEVLSKAVSQKQASTDEDGEGKSQPIACYVVVPRLPRDVSVEWHVIASLARGQMQYEKRRTECDSICLEVQHCWNRQSSQGIGLVNAGVEDEKASALEADMVFKSIVREVEHILERTSCSWENVLSIRLFYRHSIVNFNAVHGAFRSSLPCSNKDLPPLSCIPVRALEQGYIMSACIHLYGNRHADP